MASDKIQDPSRSVGVVTPQVARFAAPLPLLVAAADAISSCVSTDQLNANFIVPSVFDTQVVTKVADAVKLMGRSSS